VVADSIPTSERLVEYDGVVISVDGKVMLSRAGIGGLLDVYSITPVAPHPGPLGGTVAFSFSLAKTLTVPKALSGRARKHGDRRIPRAVVVGSDGSVTLLTGLPACPIVKSSLKLASASGAVTISKDGKFAIAAESGGLVVIKGVDTATLAQVGSVYSPTFSTPAGTCKPSSAQTLGVMADGKFVVTVQNCGLPKTNANVGAGVLLTIPFSAGTLGAPVGRLNFVVTPGNDQLLTH